MRRLIKEDIERFNDITEFMPEQDKLEIWMNEELDKERYNKLRTALINMRRRAFWFTRNIWEDC